jgi:hypothetical protein
MNKIKRLLKKAYTPEADNFYEECKNNGKFNKAQLNVIFDGIYVCGFDVEDISFFVKPNYTVKKMNTMLECLREGYDKNSDCVKFLEKNCDKFEEDQINSIIRGYNLKLSPEEMNLYVNLQYPSYKMNDIIDDLMEESIEEVKEKIKNGYYD